MLHMCSLQMTMRQVIATSRDKVAKYHGIHSRCTTAQLPFAFGLHAVHEHAQ